MSEYWQAPPPVRVTVMVIRDGWPRESHRRCRRPAPGTAGHGRPVAGPGWLNPASELACLPGPAQPEWPEPDHRPWQKAGRKWLRVWHRDGRNLGLKPPAAGPVRRANSSLRLRRAPGPARAWEAPVSLRLTVGVSACQCGPAAC